MKWRNFSTFYKVNELGQVKTVARTVGLNKRFCPSKILKPGNCNGYLFICIQENGKKRNEYVHRMVAKLFIHNPNNFKQVNHKNGIKSDNRVENLEWCNASYNCKHSYDILNRVRPNHVGERHPNRKLSLIDAMDVINRYNNKITTAKELAKEYNLNQNYIYVIAKQRTWKKAIENYKQKLL